MEQKIVFATGNEGKMREVRLGYLWISRKMELHLRKMP